MQDNKLFLATHNQAKVERLKKLLAQAGVEAEIFTPQDFEIEDVPVEFGSSLAENAEIKARSYFGKVDMPILANDAGFWVESEGLVEAPKRVALSGVDERELSREEIAESALNFWKNIARKHGGRVDAAWVDAFVLLDTNGSIASAEATREVVLCDQEFGKPHIQFPIRALYISKITGKPAVLHTPEEELLELQPVTDALVSLFR